MTNNMKCGFCDGVLEFGKPIMWHEGKHYHESCYNNACVGHSFIVGETIEFIPEKFSDDVLPTLVYDDGSNKTVKLNRKTWHQHFAEMALKNSEMATCKRLKVGSVIVAENKYAIGHGINGSVCGDVHCIDGECLVENNHCVRCVHSEANSLITAAKFGVSVKDCSIYVTHFPCFSCAKMIINSGIKTIYYINDYKNDQKVSDLCEKLNIKIEKFLL